MVVKNLGGMCRLFNNAESKDEGIVDDRGDDYGGFSND